MNGPVVVDTSVLLLALLSPGGMRRKLLVICAYGALAHYSHVGGQDQDLLDREIERHGGGEIGGRTVESLVESASTAAAHLEEFLPALPPQDVVLAGSPVLFREVEDKIRRKGHVFDRDREDAEAYSRALVAITPHIVEPFEADAVRPYDIADHRDHHLFQAAAEARASFVVTDDKGVAVEEEPFDVVCPHTGHEFRVSRFMPFVREYVDRSHFSLSDVDGELLPAAFGGVVVGRGSNPWPGLA